MKVGILALQGAVAAHARTLDRLGVTAVEVRTAEELAGVDALVLPGGESTTMDRLLDTAALREPLQARLREGLPAFGTCAGLIVLAAEVLDGRPDQRPLGGVDLVVRRNGYGRQIDSFEVDLDVTGVDDPFPAVFIRAPLVERAGPAVEVLASVEGHPVLCRQGPVWVSSFHPELSDDPRVHARFLEAAAAD